MARPLGHIIRISLEVDAVAALWHDSCPLRCGRRLQLETAEFIFGEDGCWSAASLAVLSYPPVMVYDT